MMEKRSVVFISVLGTLGGLLLAIGMCMCLLPEWNAFTPGVVLAVIGAVTLLSIWPISRKAAILLGLLGALALGVGLVHCLQTVTTFGLAVGIVGIVLLLLAVLVGRKAAGKSAIAFNGKRVLACAIGIVGALIFGAGMCLTMVWGSAYLIPGIIVGCGGLLLCVLNMVLRLNNGSKAP